MWRLERGVEPMTLWAKGVDSANAPLMPHMTYVSAYASQRNLQLQSEVFSAADEKYRNKIKKGRLLHFVGSVYLPNRNLCLHLYTIYIRTNSDKHLFGTALIQTTQNYHNSSRMDY